MSNASRTPGEPAFSSVPRREPRSLEKRHNNPRRSFFGPSALETAPSPFGAHRTAGRLFQGPAETTASERQRPAAPRALAPSPGSGEGLGFPRCFCLFVQSLEKSAGRLSPWPRALARTPSPGPAALSSPLGSCPNHETPVLKGTPRPPGPASAPRAGARPGKRVPANPGASTALRPPSGGPPTLAELELG